MGYFKINENIYGGSNNPKVMLKNMANAPCGTYNFTVFTLDANNTTKEASITINRTWRPAYIICTGDLNAQTGTGDWVDIALYRGDTFLRKVTIQGTNTSQNNPFCVSYLDLPRDGTSTYRVVFTRGGGTSLFGENGDLQAPVFSVFEV